MYECSECSRSIGPEVLQCKHTGSSACPFEVREIQAHASKLQGLSFIVLGSIFTLTVLFFPVSAEYVLTSSLFSSVIRVTLLTVVLLAGAFTVFLGISLMFSRRLLIFNTSDRVSYQCSYFLSYQYRTSIIEESEVLEAAPAPRHSAFPLSVAMLGSLQQTSTLVDFFEKIAPDKNSAEYQRKHNELQQLAERVIEGTLLDLTGRGLLQVVAASCYSSQVQDLDRTSTETRYLFFPGKPSAERIEGRLERQILHIVKEWRGQALWSELPLAPTLPLLLQSIFPDSHTQLWLQIVRFVLLDARSLDAAELASLNLFAEDAPPQAAHEATRELLENQQLNPGIYRIIREETANTLEKNLVSPHRGIAFDARRLKYLRVGLVIGIILLFTLGRYLSGLSTVRSMKEYVDAKQKDAVSAARTVTAMLPSISEISGEDISDTASGLMNRFNHWMENPGRHLKEVIRLTRSTDVAIRQQAARFLANMESNSAAVVPALRRLLRDPDVTTRQIAIQGIANCREDAVRAIPELGFLLENDPLTAPLAAQALGAIGTANSREAVKALSGAVQHADPMVQSFARQALEQIGTDEALAVIENAVRSSSGGRTAIQQPQFE